jgi:hypothetical protein
MPLHTEVEASEPIARQAVASTLQHDRIRFVVFHDGADDWLECALVCLVGDTVTEREVDGVVLSVSDSNVAQLSGAGEVFAIFMKGNGHDAVGGIECLFYAIAVVHINVNVEDALVEAEKFDDSEDNI